MNETLLASVITSWSMGLIGLFLNRYGFRNPSTRLIPSPIRHTWFAGLSIIIILFLFCLPGWLLGFHIITSLVFIILVMALKERAVGLLIQDLKLHKIDGRNLFQHSEDCYMVKGKTATFIKKRLEKLNALGYSVVGGYSARPHPWNTRKQPHLAALGRFDTYRTN